MDVKSEEFAAFYKECLGIADPTWVIICQMARCGSRVALDLCTKENEARQLLRSAEYQT